MSEIKCENCKHYYVSLGNILSCREIYILPCDYYVYWEPEDFITKDEMIFK